MNAASQARAQPKLPFAWGARTYLMGILNITPDSFSDGGQFNTPEAALKRACQLELEGADILDLGAESSRPGAQPISAEEEIRRLKPILPKLAEQLKIPICLDTWKSEVANYALQNGASAINDIHGLQKDTQMAKCIAEHKAQAILMHNRETPSKETNPIKSILRYLETSLNIAAAAGIPKSDTIVDPGIGFGKTPAQNLCILKHLKALKTLEAAMLIGTSRKSFIGLTLELPVNERLEGTLATTALAIQKGVDIIRVHDVQANLRAARLSDAICRN